MHTHMHSVRPFFCEYVQICNVLLLRARQTYICLVSYKTGYITSKNACSYCDHKQKQVTHKYSSHNSATKSFIHYTSSQFLFHNSGFFFFQSLVCWIVFQTLINYPNIRNGPCDSCDLIYVVDERFTPNLFKMWLKSVQFGVYTCNMRLFAYVFVYMCNIYVLVCM